MALRVILARLTGADLDEAVMDGALALASGASEGHIHALMVRPDPRLTLPSPSEEGMSPALYDAIFESLERAETEKARNVRAKVESWCSVKGVKVQPRAATPLSVDFTDFIGLERNILAEEARLADITVMALSNATVDNEAFESALLESGRPVMLVPSLSKPATSISNILVAWNDSPEAARAVSAAIPLMRKAAKVTVITVADGPLRETAADRLVNYLMQEGITVSAMHSENLKDTMVENRLLQAAQDTDADLLVMGGYTHSRTKELIFGGVTRHLVRHSPIKTIMCH